MPVLNGKRRRILFAVVALAVSSYATYHVYTSAAFTKRRRRLNEVLNAMRFVCETVSESAQSVSILTSELKAFLLADDETIPQSLKQAFKVGQSKEFQETVSARTAALVHGLRLGIDAKITKKAAMCGYGTLASDVHSIKARAEGVTYKDIREVSYTIRGQEQSRVHDRPSKRKGNYYCQEREANSYAVEPERRLLKDQSAGIAFDKTRKGNSPQHVLEKLLLKLFSGPGVGFASAIARAFARNLVLACFDVSDDQNLSASTSTSHLQCPASFSEEKILPKYMKVLDVPHSNPCITLAMKYMQTFISTAVTVYIEKTKGHKFCGNIVASIVNSSDEEDSVKEMLTSICKSFVETLVLASYKAVQGKHRPIKEDSERAESYTWDTNKSSSYLTSNRWQPCSTNENQVRDRNVQVRTLADRLQSSSQASPGTMTREFCREESARGARSFIDGVSKALAIPDNRKLLVDVAGTVTSEAVRSFVGAVISTASSQICSKMHENRGMVENHVSDRCGLQWQESFRNLAARSFVYASVCIAICLHLLAGPPFLLR